MSTVYFKYVHSIITLDNKKDPDTEVSKSFVYYLRLLIPNLFNRLLDLLSDFNEYTIKHTNIIKYIEKANIMGDITANQPQSINPVSFSATNTIVNTSRNPILFPYFS